MTKYRNQPTFVDGQRFDSKKEAKRYAYLKLLERAGEISDLELQPQYRFMYEGKLFMTYVADFRYVENGKVVVEDVKSPVTRQNPVYRLKKKAMKLWHGIDIFET